MTQAHKQKLIKTKSSDKSHQGIPVFSQHTVVLSISWLLLSRKLSFRRKRIFNLVPLFFIQFIFMSLISLLRWCFAYKSWVIKQTLVAPGFILS